MELSLGAHAGAYELGVGIPPQYERGNVWLVWESLRNVLRGLRVEVVSGNDSEGGASVVISQSLQMLACPPFQMHLEHRPSAREHAGGWATAEVQELKGPQVTYLAAIDKDLEHLPDLFP